MASAARTARGDKVPFAGGRYLLSHRLGNGSFGDIFEGYDTVRNSRVAVKLEKKKVRYPQLEYESKVYRVLHQPPVSINELLPRAAALLRANGEDADLHVNEEAVPEMPPFMVIGIPQIFYYDSEGDYNIMVMELCGPSLEDLFNYCHRRFSLKTVLMIAEQMLHRIQYIHEKGFVHRDIKPENFTFGYAQKAHILYVIDFGLSKLYWDCRKNTHIPFVDGKPLTGTARYCSANTHRGYEQSRRDDLESLGFLFVYFLKGSLPWQGIQAKDQQLKTIRIGEKKIATSLEDLCKGLPSELLKYCQYSRELSYQQKPDYDYLRGLFRAVAQRYGYLCKPPAQASGVGGSQNARTPSEIPSGAPPSTIKDCASYPDSHAATLSSGTGTSRRNNSPAAGGGAACEKEPDPLRGFYDWEFDWILKREGEVRRGLQLQEAAQAEGLLPASAPNPPQQPSMNPVHPSRSVQQPMGVAPRPDSSSSSTSTPLSGSTSSSAAGTASQSVAVVANGDVCSITLPAGGKSSPRKAKHASGRAAHGGHSDEVRMQSMRTGGAEAANPLARESPAEAVKKM